MAAAVIRLGAESAGNEVRDDGETHTAQVAAVREAITEHLPSTTWLRQVADPRLLDEIGTAIAAPLTDPGVTLAPSGEEEVRDEEIRAIRDFVKRRIGDLDRIVGATVGAAAGRLNSYLRTEQGPGVTRFFGDVLVYQRHRREIHERVRATIDKVDPVLGRDPEHPVRVIGHSLGGVIAVDLATAGEPYRWREPPERLFRAGPGVQACGRLAVTAHQGWVGHSEAGQPRPVQHIRQHPSTPVRCQNSFAGADLTYRAR